MEGSGLGNQLTRYGSVAVALPYLGPQGKVFMVAPSGESYYVHFQVEFPPDREGVTRVYSSIQSAVNATVEGRGDVVLVAPGAYDETVTISRSYGNLTIVGLGGRGATYIEPSTEDAGGMINHADDVTLINLGVAGEDETSANALLNTGSRFRAYRCKFEGGQDQVEISLGTVAQEAAGTHGRGSEPHFYDCEFAWGTNGVKIAATDYGAVTQALFKDCRFHNLTAAAFEESGGTASIRFRNLEIIDCIFDDQEGGTAPTKYISLNDDNGNDGIVSGCRFPTAINSGLNLVSTAVHWVGNFHTGGVSTGQPS